MAPEEKPAVNGWYVYLLQCSDGSYYTGITTDPQRRLQEHNHSPRGARYTRARRPVTMVYTERATDRSAATRREYQLRRLPVVAKQHLISRAQSR